MCIAHETLGYRFCSNQCVLLTSVFFPMFADLRLGPLALSSTLVYDISLKFTKEDT